MIRQLLVLLTVVVLSSSTATTSQASSNQPIPTGRHWLFYEVPTRSLAELQAAKQAVADQLSPRSLARRQKMMTSNPPVRICDLPPPAEFVRAIEATGCRVVHVARYLKAVSIMGTDEQIQRATDLYFVKSSRPVMGYASDLIDKEIEDDSLECHSRESGNPEPSEGDYTMEYPVKQNIDKISDAEDYGFSYRHSALVNIETAHNLGYRGRGILIGVQDTGFSNLRHRCFNAMEVVAAYDFVNGDDNVGNHGDHGDGSHGTKVLSVIAGLDSGFYIGVAPDAEFVLTKTENTEWERPIEEDAWVAGLWFHDSTGTEVLSSSLSYVDWYDYEDLDGRTAITSIAADSAVAAGIVVVNSAGNNGRDDHPLDKVGAPADASGVIAVGGVLADSSYWSASSTGPTYDGRIKPDVTAQGVGVYAASTIDLESYSPRNGTSYSCPTVTGIVALILEANRDLTPYQIIDILRETSHMSERPDTLRGYGIPDAAAAIRLAESMRVGQEINFPAEFALSAYPNPFNGRLHLKFSGGYRTRTIKVFDIAGRMVRSFPNSGEESSVDFGGLSAGSYILHAESALGVGAMRIVYLP